MHALIKYDQIVCIMQSTNKTKLLGLTSRFRHRDPEHFISNKKKCSVIYLVRVCFESFRRDFNEAKAVYIAVIKINVLLFTFVCVCFEYCYLPLSVSFLSRLEGI